MAMLEYNGMKLRRGKFYDEKGEPVALQMGNPTQIRLCEMAEAMHDEYTEGKLLDENDFFVSESSAELVAFCSCGGELNYVLEIDDEDNVWEEVEVFLAIEKNPTIECDDCNLRYKLRYNEDCNQPELRRVRNVRHHKIKADK